MVDLVEFFFATNTSIDVNFRNVVKFTGTAVLRLLMLTLLVLKNHGVCAIYQNKNAHKQRCKVKSYLDRIQLLLALGRVGGVPQLGNCIAKTRNAEPREPSLKARSSIRTPTHCRRERRHVCSAGNYTLSHRNLAKSEHYGPLQPFSDRGEA